MSKNKILCTTCANFCGTYGRHPGVGDNSKQVVYVAPEGRIGVCHHYKHFAVSCDYYTPTELDFGEALSALKTGSSVARRAWGGKCKRLVLEKFDAVGKMALLPYIYMTADGTRVPWVASQTDMLATDWYIVESKEAEA